MSIVLERFEKCPGCMDSAHHARPFFNTLMFGKPCTILHCQRCGLVYKELYPDTAGRDQIYHDGYDHFQEAAVTTAEIVSARQKLNRCLGILPSSRSLAGDLKLLDVGCGAGRFVRIASSLGYQAEGIDPYLPTTLVVTGKLERKSVGEIAPRSYDIVTMLNIAEHLAQPRDIFATVQRLIRPGGVLLITCPYGESWACRVYQRNWSHLVLDEHLLFWTPNALTYMLSGLGFSKQIRYRIGGLPFPYGRVVSPVSTSESFPVTPGAVRDTVRFSHIDSRARAGRRSWQTRAWDFARTVQQNEKISNILRNLIHLTCTGDYLEYTVGVDI